MCDGKWCEGHIPPLNFICILILASKYVMQHIESGTLQNLNVSHFITMIMVNVSHVICCFIDCYLEQVFKKQVLKSIGFCLLKVGFSLILYNQNINKRTWLTLTIIIAMKWDTCSFHKVPLSMFCITNDIGNHAHTKATA